MERATFRISDFYRTCLFCSILIGALTDAKVADWLVQKIQTPTVLTLTGSKHLKLTNGLITREFTLSPDFATIDYYSHEQQSSLLRAINPEALIKLDDISYSIGGLNTSIPRAYLNRTNLDFDIKHNKDAFHYVSHKISKPKAPYPYTPRRGAPKDIVWPPKGLRLDVLFRAPVQAPAMHKMVSVTVHYEMYDGIPLLSKWVTVSADPVIWGKVTVGILAVEYLAVNWQWAKGGYGWMDVQTDRPHGTNIDWITDPHRKKMPGSFEQVVQCSYSLIPYVPLEEDDFVSFHVLELVVGSAEPERFGLAKRKMLRLLAPQIQENPIFVHTVYSDSTHVRFLIGQMVEVGFEMMLYSFGSNFDFESSDDKYISEVAKDVAYATSRGIEVGAYDLIGETRRTIAQWMAVNDHVPPSACLASGWYDYLLERLKYFMDKTGITAMEADGAFSGYSCNASNHSHHYGYQDSVYKQDLMQGRFFKILRERGVYLNMAESYYYQGGSKSGMGYNEEQYSLPHWQDLSISRQGMFDDMFHYTPTIGWMFLPVMVYHGGGDAAAFEPLSVNAEAYNWGLAQYFGAGVQATYRGDRLYDSPQTKAMVIKWVSFFKKYRDILTSDIIHVRRADMQSVDCLMHVNPFLENKALAMVFNPTGDRQAMNLTLPLYYSGITTVADVWTEGQTVKGSLRYALDRFFEIDIYVDLPPRGITWFVLQGK